MFGHSFQEIRTRTHQGNPASPEAFCSLFGAFAFLTARQPAGSPTLRPETRNWGLSMCSPTSKLAVCAPTTAARCRCCCCCAMRPGA